MAKQPKNQPSVIEMYQGLPSNPTFRNHTIVIDHDNRISVFNNGTALEQLQSFASLIKDTIAYRWDGLPEFEKIGKSTIEARHEEMFGKNPPSGQSIELTAQRVWEAFHKNAKHNFVSEVPVTQSGRVSNISTRKYFTGSQAEGDGGLKTPQALASLRLFRRALIERGITEDKPNPEDPTTPIKVTYIDEGTLKQFVIDNAGELKTRQDPWRIFQYYRPQLLAAHLIKHD